MHLQDRIEQLLCDATITRNQALRALGEKFRSEFDAAESLGDRTYISHTHRVEVGRVKSVWGKVIDLLLVARDGENLVQSCRDTTYEDLDDPSDGTDDPRFRAVFDLN